jgi:hypothetical protein
MRDRNGDGLVTFPEFLTDETEREIAESGPVPVVVQEPEALPNVRHGKLELSFSFRDR